MRQFISFVNSKLAGLALGGLVNFDKSEKDRMTILGQVEKQEEVVKVLQTHHQMLHKFGYKLKSS